MTMSQNAQNTKTKKRAIFRDRIIIRASLGRKITLWWARQDSNLRQLRYERRVLTNWTTGPKKKLENDHIMTATKRLCQVFPIYHAVNAPKKRSSIFTDTLFLCILSFTKNDFIFDRKNKINDCQSRVGHTTDMPRMRSTFLWLTKKPHCLS